MIQSVVSSYAMTVTVNGIAQAKVERAASDFMTKLQQAQTKAIKSSIDAMMEHTYVPTDAMCLYHTYRPEGKICSCCHDTDRDPIPWKEVMRA